jgi:anti-sigma B factor antagonist
MEINHTTIQGANIVTLIGRLDVDSTREFEERSTAWVIGPVILDLSRLDYISSSGLRAFLQLKRNCAKKNTPVFIAGSFGLVEKVIRVSGFESIFPRYSTVKDALHAVAMTEV